MNYDKEMEKIIESLDYTPKLLLHSCCAPCSSAVIERLKKHFHITILYYNPNISPEEEYLKRKEEQKRYIKNTQSENELDFLDCDYESKEFEKISKGHENDLERGPRCYLCYKMRINKTAGIAKEKGFDFFGTTLSVSPYKVSNWINEIGLEISKEKGIEFLPSDFKKQNGYKLSIELSKKHDLYRQDYCGCIYSKRSE